MTDFFISYNKGDKSWATWVAATLEGQNRYTTIFQERDFRPGENFVLRMQEAMRDSERTIAVLSNQYLAALFTQSEWTSAFQKDPTGKQRTLIPVRVEPCELPPPFNVLIYCDLVDLDEENAAKALLAAASPELTPSQTRPMFPGKAKSPPAPAMATSLERIEKRDDRDAARLLLDTLGSTFATFVAQSHVRDQLRAMMLERFPAGAGLQHEELFSRYFGEMTAEERRLHEAMRAYTVRAMYEYNKQALTVIRDHAGLTTHVPRLAALEHHLEVWMAKYTNRFLPAPHMALCYVGVEERGDLGLGWESSVPFPHGIESDLRAYLDSASPGVPGSGV